MSRRTCQDCKNWNAGWCEIFYNRHEADAPRCKDHYEPKAAWYKTGRFWFCLLLGIVMVIGVVSKLTGG